MAVSIVDGLKSNPTAIRIEQEATLRLVLQSRRDGTETETATVEYRLNPKNEFVFAENDAKLIVETFTVATDPTVADRRYALKGPSGRNVEISAIVLPERSHKSKETVTVLK
jgi:hypothetical protein